MPMPVAKDKGGGHSDFRPPASVTLEIILKSHIFEAGNTRSDKGGLGSLPPRTRINSPCCSSRAR
jgi:hypothetical protein